MTSQSLSKDRDKKKMMATSMNQSSMDEHTQLDEILNELLGDQMFMNPPSPTKELVPMNSALNTLPSKGSMTTNDGNSRTVVSWQTSQAGPTKSVTVTKETVSKSPHVHTESVVTKKEEVSSYAAPRPEGYTSWGSVKEKRVESTTERRSREHMSGERVTSPEDYDSRHYNGVSSQRGYASDSEDQLSWLQQQQAKLQAKRDGRKWHHRTDTEKKLVAELKNAQNSFTRKRAQSEAEEDTIMQEYARQDRSGYQNGSVTPTPTYRSEISSPSPDRDRDRDGYRSQRFWASPSPTPESVRKTESRYREETKADKTFWVSGLERPPNTTQQTKYTFSVSPPVTAKPPPSPGPYRSAPSSPIVPQRSQASREAVRSRSANRDMNGRHHTRQRSDTTFDRDRDLSPPILAQATLPRSQGSPHHVPYSSLPPQPPSSIPTPRSPYHNPDPSPTSSVVEETVVRKVATPKSAGNAAVHSTSITRTLSGFCIISWITFISRSHCCNIAGWTLQGYLELTADTPRI